MGGLHLSIIGNPVAMPRPQARSIGGRAQVFNPRKVKRKGGWKPHPWTLWHGIVVQRLTVRADPKPILGAAFVSMVFTFSLAASRRRPKDGWSVDKPDLDNLAKLVLDAMQLPWLQERGLHVFADDSQVASLTLSKVWAREGDAPGLLLTAQEIR